MHFLIIYAYSIFIYKVLVGEIIQYNKQVYTIVTILVHNEEEFPNFANAEGISVLFTRKCLRVCKVWKFHINSRKFQEIPGSFLVNNKET